MVSGFAGVGVDGIIINVDFGMDVGLLNKKTASYTHSLKL